ncbi:hypothetical protein [Rhizobium changzhiense]|uniref:hypothetical protein n=1 Tax=Rhizobium changzhiense TaxID=2692317 RepID=UPI003B8A8525
MPGRHDREYRSRPIARGHNSSCNGSGRKSYLCPSLTSTATRQAPDRDSDVGEDAATGAGIGAAVGGAGGLLTGLGLMAIPGVGPVVAAGWLAATAAGAVAGAVAGGAAGGLIGALTDSGVSEDDAHLYAEGVRRGGSLVTAKVDDARASEAQAILQGSNWVDPVERRRAYNDQGWTRFDDTLDPYAPEQIEQERDRYRRTI